MLKIIWRHFELFIDFFEFLKIFFFFDCLNLRITMETLSVALHLGHSGFIENNDPTIDLKIII